jgi:hypothetical protein
LGDLNLKDKDQVAIVLNSAPQQRNYQHATEIYESGGIAPHMTTIWQLQKLWKNLQYANKVHRRMEMERFNLQKLNEGEVTEQYQVTNTKKLAAFQNLEDNGDINKAQHTIRDNIKILSKECPDYCDPKNHESWFDEEC